MEKYLTKKCRPGKAVQLLETLALIILMCFLTLCLWTLAEMLMMAYKLGVFGWTNLLPVIPAVLLALAMCPIAERIRARHHARLIVKALLAADGRIPVDDAEQVIGVRRAAEFALQLVEQGYMTDVRLAKGFLCFAEVADGMAPEEEVTPLFRDVEM